ncbi:MAG TPA: pantoate--beta-alanine ligase [Bacteroidales bacterium]|jgi:pantoate--beta-alanine ligase|nr:pantoate--beta-alanine ligase [Bacteroidales bacterium]MDY0085972.1 pantoate--beta-alanine ligase [Bacteroidales bacterium]HPE43049.1 pantoate--beta-alanine ligase [Bacteroidales bacterium]
MQIFETIRLVQQQITAYKKAGKTIGFVPTMGALHEGHLALMRQAKSGNDILVVSIFVNPIQFNNPADLEKYPRTLEKDKAMLREIECDVLFAPDVSEMYPQPDNTTYHFGKLATVMEGAFRPGHFNGVAVVVRKLFEILTPDKAYFGEKDFQQLAIIQSLVMQFDIPVQIIPCSIIREKDGLAMSSRNIRLSKDERAVAPKIYEILKKSVSLRKVLSPFEMEQYASKELQKIELFDLEYVTIADDIGLQAFAHWNDVSGARIFVALQLGKVRLIDNVRIF